MVRARFFWTDGHNDLRDVDLTGDEIVVPEHDGLAHVFASAGRTDDGGLEVWVEESRQWERFHENGRRSLVYQHADVNPGRYSAGAPLRGAAEGFTLDIWSLERAKQIADEASGCPQPCTCPPWSE